MMKLRISLLFICIFFIYGCVAAFALPGLIVGQKVRTAQQNFDDAYQKFQSDLNQYETIKKSLDKEFESFRFQLTNEQTEIYNQAIQINNLTSWQSFLLSLTQSQFDQLKTINERYLAIEKNRVSLMSQIEYLKTLSNDYEIALAQRQSVMNYYQSISRQQQLDSMTRELSEINYNLRGLRFGY